MAVINQFPGLSYTSVTTYQVSDLANVYFLNPSTGVDFGAVINGIMTGPGKKIVLAPGTYDLTTALAVTESGTTIEGSGSGATYLNIAAASTADGVSFTNVSNCALKHLTVTSPTARASGNAVHVTGGDPDLPLSSYSLMDAAMVIEDVSTTNQFCGILVDNDETSNYFNWRTYIRGGRHRNLSTNGYAIWINTAVGGAGEFGASQFIEDVWVGDSTAAILAGIRLTGTGDCTLVNNEVFATNGSYALLMDPVSGGFLTSVKVIGGFYDRCQTACMRIAPHASVGKFGDINLTNVWFAGSTTGNAIDIVGAAAKGIYLTACTAYSAEGSPGWCAKVDAATGVHFTAFNCASATTGGILFTGSASNFSVIGGEMTGAGVGTSGLTTLPTGIQVDAGCDHYQLCNVNMSSAGVGSTAKITNTPGTAANQRIVANNVTA